MIGVRSIAEPTVKDTIIHRMDPRAKILILISVAFVAVTLDNPETMFLLFLIVLSGFALARMPAIKLKTLAILLILLIWGTVYSQALFYSQLPRTVIFTIISPDFPVLGWMTNGGLFVYAEGLQHGAIQGLRSASIMSLGLLICWTTDSRDMLNGLVGLSVPYSVAFMVVTAVRFLPIIITEVTTVITVQRLRGFSPKKFGSGIIKTSLNILTPTLSNCDNKVSLQHVYKWNLLQFRLKTCLCNRQGIPVIEIKKLSRSFGNLLAVDNLNLDVGNEIFGLLGPNGAGKSTTVMMLTTLLRPSSGTAKVCGYDIVKDSKKVRSKISYVPQDMAVDRKLTGRENVMLYAKLYGILDRNSKVDEVIEMMGLSDRADDLVAKYSGGMRRRLELAQALVHEPEVLFLDEPTLGLDVGGRKKIWEHIKMLKAEGMTIFMTTHYLEEAEKYCNRVAIIDKGRITAIGSPENLVSSAGENASLNDVFLEKVKTPEEQAGFNSTQFRNLLRRR